MQISSGLNLEVALFNGMESVPNADGSRAFQPVSAGEAIEYPLTRDTIYTLVVRRSDIRVQTPGTYQASATFSPGEKITIPNKRNNTTNQPLEQPPELVAGRTHIQVGDALILTHPGSVSSVGTPAENATQVRFGGADDLGFGTQVNQVQQIALLGGDLSASGANADDRILYVQNYGYRTDSIDGDFSNVVDSNGTGLRLGWDALRGVWVTESCAGFKLDDGRTFITELDPQRRDVTFQGTLANFTARAVVPGVSTAATITLDWEGIAPGSETRYHNGTLMMNLIGDRVLEIQSTEMDIRRQPESGQESPIHVPLDVNIPDRDAVLTLDWINMERLRLDDEAITFDFLDEPRTITSRTSANVQSVTAVGDVIQIIYHDLEEGLPGEQRLLLPASESYIEIITPAGLPQFDGRSTPENASYMARALNNLGGECYPINTLLPQANCPANGHPNPANSNVWFAVTDQTAYGDEINLSLTRSYNSTTFATGGPFGQGWTSAFLLDHQASYNPATNSREVRPDDVHQFPVSLDVTWSPRGIVTFRTPSGSQHVFVSSDDAYDGGTMTAITMPEWTLFREDVRDSTWTLRQADGLSYYFDRAGRLLRYGYPTRMIEIELSTHIAQWRG